MENFIGKMMHVTLHTNTGLYTFNGELTKIEQQFFVFKTNSGPLIVNSQYIKTMQPLESKI